MFINKGQMEADKYIQKSREYLDYIEEHIENVRKAFCDLSEKCKDMIWVSDDFTWHTFRSEVINHDLSKLSMYEFVQYRDSFYPVTQSDKEKSHIGEAWDHHKLNNRHHHETVGNFMGIIHMVIDWTAMGYRFGGTAQEYYEANKDRIFLSEEHEDFMYELFKKIEEQ